MYLNNKINLKQSNTHNTIVFILMNNILICNCVLSK